MLTFIIIIDSSTVNYLLSYKAPKKIFIYMTFSYLKLIQINKVFIKQSKKTEVIAVVKYARKIA